jgi:hypothetical protein
MYFIFQQNSRASSFFFGFLGMCPKRFKIFGFLPLQPDCPAWQDDDRYVKLRRSFGQDSQCACKLQAFLPLHPDCPDCPAWQDDDRCVKLRRSFGQDSQCACKLPGAGKAPPQGGSAVSP